MIIGIAISLLLVLTAIAGYLVGSRNPWNKVAHKALDTVEESLPPKP